MPRLKEQTKPATLTVRVPRKLAEDFQRFADEQERTLSQELRRAMRAHMEKKAA